MPEILTESFCERCGTRYTFQAAPTARSPLTRAKMLSKGFRNYVLSDETSMSEAMASARSDDLRRTSGEQLDAFHKAFNFCMSCRQYTCANCWNDIEGRCLSCSPTFDSNALSTPFPLLDQVIGLPQLEPANGNGHANGLTNGHVEVQPDGADISAWPSIDLEPEGGAAEAIVAEPVVPEPLALLAGSLAPETPAEVTTPEATATIEAVAIPEAELPFSADDFAQTFGAASPGEPVAERAVSPTVEPVESTVEAASAEQELLVAEPAAEPGTETVGSIADVDAEAVPEALTAAETAPAALDAEAEGEPEPIADIEGWAASAAAQTSTMLNRFRAFPGKRPAARPKSAHPDDVAATAPIHMDDQPLSMPLPAAASDVVPIIDLFIDSPAAQTAAVVAAPADIVDVAPVVETTTTEPEVAAIAEPESVVPAEPEAAPVIAELEPESVAFAEPEVVAQPEAAAEAESEAVAVAEPEAVAEVEPVAVAEPEPVPVASVEAVTEVEPVAAIEPAPVAAAPVAPTPEPVAPPPPAPIAPQVPVWQMVAPDLMPPSAIPSAAPSPSGTPVWPPLAKAAPGEPQWPAVPAWPARQNTPTMVSGADAVWAQSSRDLLNRPETGVQACINCGLPLSARARFCRRCGTNQVSA